MAFKIAQSKDHKGENKKVKESAIKTYFIRSREHLDRVKEEVIFLCEHYGARAYINVAGKDFRNLQDLLLAKLAEYNLVVNILNLKKYNESIKDLFKNLWTLQDTGE